MIIVDEALKRRESKGRPIRVGMIGAGFMGRGTANQVVNSVPGMRLVAIANRSVDKARRAYEEAGVTEIAEAGTQDALEDLIRAGKPAITSDFGLLCASDQIDAILELTGAIDYGAARRTRHDRGGQAFHHHERRARRHDRPAAEAQGRRGRGDLLGHRRRPARSADESRAIRSLHRADAAHLR